MQKPNLHTSFNPFHAKLDKGTIKLDVTKDVSVSDARAEIAGLVNKMEISISDGHFFNIDGKKVPGRTRSFSRKTSGDIDLNTGAVGETKVEDMNVLRVNTYIDLKDGDHQIQELMIGRSKDDGIMLFVATAPNKKLHPDWVDVRKEARLDRFSTGKGEQA